MDYSKITKWLLIGTTPARSDFGLLSRLGVRLVINMRFWRGSGPSVDESTLQYLRIRTFDSPLLPIPMEALMRGVRAALETVGGGGKVYVHCSRGRHRSIAMAAAILIAQGMTPERAMLLIKEQRKAADPDALHIRRQILRFAEYWARSGE